MPNIGDKVNVNIRNTSLAGTLTVGPSASMTVPGEIVEDYGDMWMIELAISVDGKNRILIPKSAQLQPK